MLRFWSSKLHFWRKSRRKASFLRFKASILKEVPQKSFVWQNHLNHTSVDNQITWTSNHLTSKSLESQSIYNRLIWISSRLTTKSLEFQINWQPNHLNLKSTDKQNQSNHTSIDNQTTWISNPLTTNSLENLKSVDNQIIWISNWLTTKLLESQTNWQPHHLKFKWTDNQHHLKHTSIDNQIIWTSNQLTTKIIWISNQMTTKSFDSQLVWIWHQLTFEPIELRTLPSYRFLIFGNFRHRLVRSICYCMRFQCFQIPVVWTPQTQPFLQDPQAFKNGLAKAFRDCRTDKHLLSVMNWLTGWSWTWSFGGWKD